MGISPLLVYLDNIIVFINKDKEKKYLIGEEFEVKTLRKLKYSYEIKITSAKK